ncbi:hypothetical protein JCM15060_14680 [Halanaerobaculum tunisiense]
MLKFAIELDLMTPLISNNGVLVKKPNQEMIAQKFIAPEIANRLLEHAQDKELHISFYFPDCICVEEITEKADVHIKEEKVMPKAVGDLAKTLDKDLINVLFNIASDLINQVVADLLDQYQISPQEVISFGNNYNDVTMIELAGCGVAMTNAPAEVKEAADKVAKDNDQAGVAIMLEKIFL